MPDDEYDEWDEEEQEERARHLAAFALQGLLTKYGWTHPPHLIAQKAWEYGVALAEEEAKHGDS